MLRQCAAKEEPSPHLSFLRLLTSPLRLLCASIWHIVQDRDVLSYEMLEEFISVITETIPELLNHRQRAQLILGLRAKVVLELCRSESSRNTETIQRHLDRIRIPAAALSESVTRDKDVEASEYNFLALVDILLNDPMEKDAFFQEVFPVKYGLKYDLALERLVWTFVSRLEEVLPVPSIHEVAAMLSISPSVMKECFQALSQPQELLNSLHHHKSHTCTEIKAILPVTALADDDYIFSCLSHPPLVRAGVDTMEGKAIEIELESEVCEEVSIECEEVSALDAEVDAGDVLAEAGQRLSSDSGVEESVKLVDLQQDTVSVDADPPKGLSGKESNVYLPKEMPTAVDEQEEPPSSSVEPTISQVSCFINEDRTVEYEDRVAVKGRPEGSVLGGGGEARSPGTEAQPEELASSSEHCYSRTEPAPGASEGVLDGLCLQPTVRLERIDISGKPLPPPPPRQSSRVRKKKILMLWRKNRGPEIAWLVEPPKTVPPDMKPKTAKSDADVKPSAVTFACSQCSFKVATGTSLEQHIRKKHPDEFGRLLSTGMIKTGEPKPPAKQTTDLSDGQNEPPKIALMFKTRPIGTKGSSDSSRALPVPVPEKTWCTSCGKWFQHLHELKEHISECSDAIKKKRGHRSGKSNKPGSKASKGSNEKSAPMVFSCSKCSFHDATETSLHQHIMKNHPDEFSRLLSAGIRQTVGPKAVGNQTTGASEHQKVPPRRMGPVPKTCPLCAKTFTRGTDMRRHLKSHSGERLHCCLGCGRCFLHIHHLKRHTAACKEVSNPHPHQDSQLEKGDKANSTSPNEAPGTKVVAGSKDDPQDSKANAAQEVETPTASTAHVDQEVETPTASTALADGETPDPRLCPMCGVVLAQASDMERHQSSHLVEKPYECMHCSKMYRYPYNLKKHVDQCHGKLGLPGSETVEPFNDDSSAMVEAGSTLLPGDPRSKKCPTCGKTFTRAADMRRHQKCHTAHRFECSKCSEGFRYPLNLKQHEQNCIGPTAQPQELVTAKSPLICSTCGKTFSFLTHLKRHERAHRLTGKPAKRWHKCTKCEEVFRTLYDLGKHQRCHWGDDPLRCTQCGRRFSTSGQLANHKEIHSLVCTMKCTMCQETFTELSSLRRHYLEAHNVCGAYPCSHCEKSFTELCPLVRHVRTHTGERPFPCHQCPRSFSSPTKLWLHRRVHSEQKGGRERRKRRGRERQERQERERRHLCHECGKCFYTRMDLTRHEVVHREERPHMCTQCGKAFKRLRSLTAHMESHLEKEARMRYPCTYCGKSFMKAVTLVRHNRIHTGERPHRCSECNKSFLTHSEVLKHMRFHTGERPFKCEVCGKKFTQSCYLTVHMRLHTGERPYACSVCDKRFSGSVHRNRHMLTHTGEKPHVCECCGKAFSQKYLLNYHLKTCT